VLTSVSVLIDGIDFSACVGDLNGLAVEAAVGCLSECRTTDFHL